MLVQCEECGLQISDKAISCPHCGLPLKGFEKKPTRGKSRKRHRLPNGFGRITKIKGRLKNPYRAMVTVGKTPSGAPIGKLLKPRAYFETYNDAYQALLEYNKNPYDLSYFPTVEEVHDAWFKTRYEKGKSNKTIQMSNTVWNHFADVKNIPFRDIRVSHIRTTLDSAPITMKAPIKSLWNMMFDYAVEYELTDKNYARMFKCDKDIKAEIKANVTPHKTFTQEEMEMLWKNKGEYTCQLMLIQCYTGLRPQELITIKIENIHLDEHYFVGGIKTDAGTNRIIPIHPLIRDIIADLYNKAKKIDSDYLVNGKNGRFLNKPVNYDWLRREYKKWFPNHQCHDGRKHFITLAKKYNVDTFALKRIVGHSINDDLTESVYTERTTPWLYKEICKIEMY